MKKNTWNVLFVLLGLLAAAAGLWLLRGGADWKNPDSVVK